ncbi:MAG TPA: YggT family protein [Thermoanaerobaculia bacterium]|nr:YggT family protein [Thermoanaerobaculia bacterium]
MNLGGAAARALFETVLFVLQAVQWLVIIAALVSWVSPDPRNPIVRFLWATTEPLFRPFRRLVPPSRTGGIDLSPIFVIVLIFFLSRLIRLAAAGAF